VLVMVHEIQVAEGRCADFEEVLRGRDAALAAQDGCLGFELLRRPAPAEREYMLMVRWTSSEAFDDWVCGGHTGHSHMALARDMVEHVETRGYTLAGTDAKRVG
jgi:heme-degrading monooxygenase HmoA